MRERERESEGEFDTLKAFLHAINLLLNQPAFYKCSAIMTTPVTTHFIALIYFKLLLLLAITTTTTTTKGGLNVPFLIRRFSLFFFCLLHLFFHFFFCI